MIHRYVIRDRKLVLSRESIASVIKSIIITEKSTRTEGTYFFNIASWANKFNVKQAVEKMFDVKVKSVNTLCLKGKNKRFKGYSGKRASIKKAVICLEKGYTIDKIGVTA